MAALDALQSLTFDGTPDGEYGGSVFLKVSPLMIHCRGRPRVQETGQRLLRRQALHRGSWLLHASAQRLSR